ncbi:hypothetical protein [Solibacillus sp. FSL K6-1126]|uniref:hypothetical protein n=1 Tax=Solibacillus sp. FSL K6-1126 TaxID=2921463 RepID=UPI0030FACA2F
MFKRNKTRVVPVAEYGDYTERFEEMEKIRQERTFATRKDVVVMSAIPTLGAAGLVAYNKLTAVNPSVMEVMPVTAMPDITSLPDTYTAMAVNAPIPTGYVADKSLEVLATILDPVIDILIAISFPIASVIMIGACFFFMIGNPERAWSMIMNAGLGYVLIQISPMFLDILRTVGEAI